MRCLTQARLQQEIALLKELKHPNVVRYINFIKTQEHLNIILEYACLPAACKAWR